MFIKEWIQGSCMIYAVIGILALSPSVQLSESPMKHSIVRRNEKHKCDIRYESLPTERLATCVGSDQIVHQCEKSSCNQALTFGDCLSIIGPRGILAGESQPVMNPESYVAGPKYITVRTGDKTLGCDYFPQNASRQSCDKCHMYKMPKV
ncbi:uncharacterized protein PGTG_16391 [Puccinia graminis f. sp. tritici CRL 75-36-700-3]|uniref:Uncharacterized protein n=1 Tax=Puccinia graminis f. sp. tritici (strain CRL 75-36-700-3 / race SCCL) TaxID=418459 RepID=E3L3S5_PUCGT|nr:uncharacterized protein PGTG_16391 [Puccinia graminis f. sp. tritici CRL 75-36-700-3]EFP91200.2 hypothetical protein PGTG_16391 [Puccinia graminis f. sp. tritici CRL 75-36-700-3]